MLRGDVAVETFEAATVKAFSHLGLKAGTEEALGRAVDVLDAALSALFAFLGDAEARTALAQLSSTGCSLGASERCSPSRSVSSG